jgi:hypothetical protein
MGNCIQGNNIVVPQTAHKRPSNVSRISKRSNEVIPTYPSIEDVINNHRNRNKECKENFVF